MGKGVVVHQLVTEFHTRSHMIVMSEKIKNEFLMTVFNLIKNCQRYKGKLACGVTARQLNPPQMAGKNQINLTSRDTERVGNVSLITHYVNNFHCSHRN